MALNRHQKNKVLWDDLRFPVTNINPPGQASDPDRESTSGLFLFASNGTELIFTLAQMPHSWKEGSEISPHLHWTKTTSASGDVAWRMRYKHAAIGSVIDSDWTDGGLITDSHPNTPDNDTADEHLKVELGDMDMTGYKISHCILFEISRVGGDASDTYGADARLLEFDIHYQIDSMGSEAEYEKLPY